MIADLDGRCRHHGRSERHRPGCGKGLPAHGTRVVLADIDDERLAEAVEEIRKADGEALAVHCDVTNDEDVDALHRAALESSTRLTR